MKKLYKRNEIEVLLLSCIVFCYVFISAYSATIIKMEWDSGYYLATMQRISEGLKLYVDFPNGYTPLFFYMAAAMKWIFGVGISFPFFVVFNCVLLGITAYYIYKICLICASDNRILALCTTLFFVIISPSLEGTNVMLEIPSMVFGIPAIYYALSNKGKPYQYMFVGLLATCAMLSKQYGAGYMVLIALWLLAKENRCKNLFYYAVGCLIPIFICLLYFGEPFIYLFKPGYAGSSVLTGNEGWMVQLVSMLQAYIRHLTVEVPVLPVFLIIAIAFKRSLLLEKKFIFFLLGFLCFMMMFFVNNLNHYHLYVVPFSLFMSLMICNAFKGSTWYKIMMVLLCASIVMQASRTTKNFYREGKSKEREKQLVLAKEISNIVPKDKTLYISGPYTQQYYLADQKAPGLDYSFGSGAVTESDIESRMQAADFVLLDKGTFSKRKKCFSSPIKKVHNLSSDAILIEK